MKMIWLFLEFMEKAIFLGNYIIKSFILTPITGATFYVDATNVGVVPSW